MNRISPDDVILGLLARQRSYGYLLLEHFRPDCPLGRIWSLSTSQLYSILKRLESREEIEGREFFPEDAPPRTEYWLTPSGRYRFENWLHTPFPSASTRSIRTEFLSRLVIARQNHTPVGPIIEAQREACERQRAKLLLQCEQASDEIVRLSIELVIAELTVILDWLNDCARTVPSTDGAS